MNLILNKELGYRDLCKIFGEQCLRGGTDRKRQFTRWGKHCKIVKTKRNCYIIEHEFTPEEKETLSFNPKRYDLQLKAFAERRHITILTEVDGWTKSTDRIEYECNFHKGVVHHTKVCDLLRNIGCPLCCYPMGRFEVMLYLGIEGALHRHRLEGVEYDILLPKEKIAVEVDGLLFHDEETDQIKEATKFEVAERNGYRLIKLCEQDVRISRENYIEGDKAYFVPYSNATKAERHQIISLVQKILPYKHSDDLWDKAADYMRDWKSKTSTVIKQYDNEGNLIHEFQNFTEIKEAICSGEAFGFKWSVQK